jgi:hypothetical protein
MTMTSTASRLWPALLLAPSLALTDLVTQYVMVPPLCEDQAGQWMHPLSLVFIIVGASLTVHAASALWRLTRQPSPFGRAQLPDAEPRRTLFLARVACGSAALSLWVMLALWMPAWFLSPCQA